MEASDQINYGEFNRIHIRVGKVVKVEDFPASRRPAYKLWIDFGNFGVKKSSAQATKHYARETLLGRLVIAVTNFPPKQIADFMSEVLVLGVPDDLGEPVLLNPDKDVPLGGKVY